MTLSYFKNRKMQAIYYFKHMRYTVVMILLYLLIGAVSGGLFTLVGTGAGLVIVPSLIYFAHFHERMAVGTSIALLLPPIGLFAALEYYQAGDVNFRAAFTIIIGFVISSIIVSRVALHLPDAVIGRAFGVLAILIGIKMVFFR